MQVALHREEGDGEKSMVRGGEGAERSKGGGGEKTGRGRIVEEIGRRMKSGDQEGEMMKEREQVEAKMKMEEGFT